MDQIRKTALAVVLTLSILGGPIAAVAEEVATSSEPVVEVTSSEPEVFEDETTAVVAPEEYQTVLLAEAFEGDILFSQEDMSAVGTENQNFPSGFDTPQTLGTNLTGTLGHAYLRGTFTPGHPTWGSTGPIVAYLHQCDDAGYSVNCALLGNDGYDVSPGENLIDFDFSAQSISFDPSKYYFFQFQAPWGFTGKVFSFFGSLDPDSYQGGEVDRDMTAAVGYPIPGTVTTNLSDLYFVITGSAPAPLGASSVLFLPGFQGSALKEGGDLRWPPSVFSEDVARLALDENGESVNQITVAGVLGDFYGTSIYGDFSEFMDGLVTDDVISEWKPFAYDWRYSFTEILEEGVQTDSGIVSLVDTVEDLAINSKSGRVTIVAHSMGGLLGKMLIKKLESEGKEGLIDSLVMVGTPQLGTPQGIGGLLHGDQLGIGMGIFVKSAEARAIAQNMASAHTLMPSPRYFDEVVTPVISFDENADFTDSWRTQWGVSIDSYSEFEEFTTGVGVARSEPDASNLSSPEVLSAELVGVARDFHNEFDTYEFPSHIRVVQIAGWGQPTVAQIKYKKKHIIFDGYETLFTREGDKTVVYSSAVATDSGESYFFNLFDYNELINSNAEHKDLLGAAPLQTAIGNLLKGEELANINFITDSEPEDDSLPDQLLVTTRSPVLLGVHDSQGRFTGIDSNQDASSEALEIKEEIPNSYFIVSGEDQHLFLPKSGEYVFEFVGTGIGPATVETGTFSEDQVISTAVYTDIPVTPSTKATFTIDTEGQEEVFIEVDSNGDGEIDVAVMPDGHEAVPTLEELLTNLKVKILALPVKEKLKTRLLKKIELLEKKIAKQRHLRVSKIISNLEKRIIKKGQKGKITDTDVEDILEMLEDIGKAL